jgi:hypothetical protein
VVPQFAQLIGQNVVNASAIPEAERANRFAQLASLFGAVPGLLGQQSQGLSTSEGPGLGYSAVSAFAGGLGSGAGNAATAAAKPR